MQKSIFTIVIISILVLSGCGNQAPTQPNTATVYIPPIQCMTCGNNNVSTASKGANIQVKP